MEESLVIDSTLVTSSPLQGIEVLFLGGWVIWPLILLSIVALWIFFERFLLLRAVERDHKGLNEALSLPIRSHDVDEIKQLCTTKDIPLSRLLRSGLDRLGHPIEEIRAALESTGRQEAFVIEKRTEYLATIAGIAPMLGFLGTVTGMITTFQEIQSLQGNVNPAVLAGGIWEALITTAAGLSIGVSALLMYNLLMSRIDRIAHNMERSASQVVDVLSTPA